MKRIKYRLISYILLLTVSLILTGCGALIVGGVGAAGGYFYKRGKQIKSEQQPVSRPVTENYTTGLNTTGRY